MIKNLKLEVFLIIISGALLFLLTPWILITAAPAEFWALNIEFLLTAGLAHAFLFIVIALALLFLFAFVRKGFLVAPLIRFAFYWLILSAFLFPLAHVTGGMVDPRFIPADSLHFGLLLILCLLLVSLTYSRFKNPTLQFTFIFLSLNIVILLWNSIHFVAGFYGPEESRALLCELSKKKNIIVLSFDGVPSNVVSRVIETNAAYRESLKDFVYFPNAVSTSPATRASAAGSLLGNVDLKTFGETEKELLKNGNYGDSLINKNEYDVATYGDYNAFNFRKNRRAGPLHRRTSFEFDMALDIYKYALARVGSGSLVRFYETLFHTYFQKPVRALKAKWILASGLETAAEFHKGPDWDKPNSLSILDFQEMLQGLNTGTTQTKAIFAHFLFTHFPVDFDENCTYRGNDEEWFPANQNEMGLFNQTSCVVSLLVRYLQELEKLGVYDDSLIVLKSDHGEPAFYYDSQPYNLRINGHNAWGVNRYLPMLLIKDFHSRKDQISVRQELVTLNDLAKTLCLKTEDSSCEKFPGVDLLSQDLQSNDWIYVYVVKDSKSSFRIDDHRMVRIPRNRGFLDSLKATPGVTLSE